jgi:hypothetical protein
MSQEDETLVVVEKPKRAPRKRVAAVVSEQREAPPRTPRKRTPKKESDEVPKRTPRKRVVKEKEEVPVPRKAPTPLATEKRNEKKSKKQRYVVAFLMFVGIASSAAVGLTDEGRINVEATITARNEQSRAAGRENEIVPVQNTEVAPDGGLVGLMASDNSQPSQPAATSSDDTASSSAPVGNIPLTAQEVEQLRQVTATEDSVE